MDEKLDILKRYFSGNYSRKEYNEVKNRFQHGEYRDQLGRELEDHWSNFELSPDETTNVDHLLHRVHHRFYLEENKRTLRLRPLQQLQRVAAVLFIPLLLGFAAYFFAMNQKMETQAYAEIQCPDGVRAKFILPDGSTGVLNNGSRLKYLVPFKNNRKVELVGEAYFDVKKNGNPFHVMTNNLDVKVMGTTFNVIAYEADKKEEVILATGKVNISSPDGDDYSILTPNQRLVFDTNNQKFWVHDVDPSQFTSWMEGKLVFRNESLEEVARKIGRWYNADVSIQDEELKKYTYHATFMNHNLEELLNLLTYTSPMSFEIEKDGTTASDQYLKKKKVILKLDQSKIKQFN